MSNSPFQTGAKVFFVQSERIERRARLQGSWLNIFDVTVPPGGSAPRHIHAGPQVFRILEGRLKIWRMTDRGPEEIEASAGDIVKIAASQPHGYSNPGPATAVFSAIADSDMAELPEDAATAKPSAETLPRIRTAANAYGVRIVAA
jgi:quercetin dioxygenase-like cupin family protein